MKKINIALITALSLILIIVLLFLVFNYKKEDLQIIHFNKTIENFPKIDGSTSNKPLINLIACRSLNLNCAWEKSSYSNEKFIEIRENAELLQNINEKVKISKTHEAYLNLINGTTDIILVATLPSLDEKNYAKEKGVSLEATPIALDAFVFLLNKENPINDLSIEQIKEIYRGKIKNWDQLGWTNNSINPYIRERNSGSQELMEKLVLNSSEINTTRIIEIMGMGGLINRLANDPYGVGYTVYYYQNFIFPNSHLKMVVIDGVAPNYETISSRGYVYTTEVYAVIREDLDKESSAFELRNWLLTEEGQKVVVESGYVPILKIS